MSILSQVFIVLYGETLTHNPLSLPLKFMRWLDGADAAMVFLDMKSTTRRMAIVFGVAKLPFNDQRATCAALGGAVPPGANVKDPEEQSPLNSEGYCMGLFWANVEVTDFACFQQVPSLFCVLCFNTSTKNSGFGVFQSVFDIGSSLKSPTCVGEGPKDLGLHRARSQSWVAWGLGQHLVNDVCMWFSVRWSPGANVFTIDSTSWPWTSSICSKPNRHATGSCGSCLCFDWFWCEVAMAEKLRALIFDHGVCWSLCRQTAWCFMSQTFVCVFYQQPSCSTFI